MREEPVEGAGNTREREEEVMQDTRREERERERIEDAVKEYFKKQERERIDVAVKELLEQQERDRNDNKYKQDNKKLRKMIKNLEESILSKKKRIEESIAKHAFPDGTDRLVLEEMNLLAEEIQKCNECEEEEQNRAEGDNLK